MTTCTNGLASPGAEPGLERATTLLPYLHRLHAEWREEARGELEPARHRGAGIWIRWAAVRYLQTTFAHRLARELAAANRVRGCLTSAQENRLWALSELLDLLGTQAEHQMGLCQAGIEFIRLADRLLRALDSWCEEVEQDFGHLRWGDLSEESREGFAALADDPRPHGP